MNIALGNYYPADSFLHRLDPRLKLVMSLVFMVLLFVMKSFAALGAYAVFLLVLVVAAQLPLSLILKSLRTVLFLALFAFVINLFATPGTTIWQWRFLSISDAGLSLGLCTALRLFLLVSTSTVWLTLTTTPLMIADAFESLLKPLERIGFPAHELGMMMSIALRFVPALVEESDKIIKAQSSRGADYDTGGIITKAKGLVSILIPLFVSSFKRADELALAMEARCYRGAVGRTKMNSLQLRSSDILAFFICLLCIGIFFFLEHFPWVL